MHLDRVVETFEVPEHPTCSCGCGAPVDHLREPDSSAYVVYPDHITGADNALVFATSVCLATWIAEHSKPGESADVEDVTHRLDPKTPITFACGLADLTDPTLSGSATGIDNLLQGMLARDPELRDHMEQHHAD